MAGASKPSKLHARIAAAADVLGSLTTTTTTTTTGTTTTSMHMGLAWELHLDTNHRAVAAQVLDYCIDAARLARSSEAPALVRGLVAAASHDQLRAWNLSDSITTVNGSAADTKLGTKLRKALTKLGLSRTSQDALASAFVAVVMHLSAGNVSSCAALLGVDAPALTASLATHPGGAVGAAATLYRALVAWVLEFVNTRLSAPEGADPPVAVVSVVAMPDTAAPAGGLDFGATLAHRARLHLDRIQSNAVRAVYTQLLDDEIAPARMAGKFDLTDPPGIATTRSVRRAFPDEDQAGTVHTALAAVLGSSSLLVVREAAAMVADMADTAPPAVAAAAATASAASLGVPTMRRTPSMKKRPAAASGGDSPKLPGVSGSLVRDLDADMASLAIALEDANVFSVFTSPVAGLDGSTDPHAAHVAAAATTFPRHGALTVRVPLTKFASRYAGVASTLLRIPATAARPPSDLTELVLAAVGDTDRIVTNGAPSGEDAVWVSARGLRLAEGAVSVYREWKRAMRQSSASIGGVSVYSAVAPISPAQLHAYPMPMAPVSPFSPPPHSAYGPPPPMSFDDAASVATTDYYDDDDMSDTVFF
ncbi:hypothetical protein BC828DRAFT_251252 [Blastocladiella britannica]|nr:hypothetical protein BC828DRAFT_251252 [Blastocladiella britannica]